MSIEELEEYYKTVELPEKFDLHPAIHIPNVKLFVEKEMYLAKMYGQKHLAFDRLVQLKTILDEKEPSL